jgi:uncharacterized membrane protein
MELAGRIAPYSSKGSRHMSDTASNESPVIQEVKEQEVESAVAVAGHPIHAMSVHFPIALVILTLGADLAYWWSADPFWVRVGLWSSGLAFFAGIAAGVAGTAELLLVPGIRNRVTSWAHGVAAMMLLAVAGMNWGLRFSVEDPVLPHGLLLSLLAASLTGLAGWHGGKLVFHHGVGLMVSAKD